MSSTPSFVINPQPYPSQARTLRIVQTLQGRLTEDLRTVIKLDRVSKIFPSQKSIPVIAISEFSHSVFETTATLITGASGSGKTTLLSLIGGMTRPTSGRIQISGRDTSRMSEEMLTNIRRSHFGFVFQDSLLIHGLSTLENVMLPAFPRRDVGAELGPKALKLLEKFDLADRAHDKVECLSGGEQQRVSIARALINDPDIVIADEPTAHLGPRDTRRVLNLFADLRADGKTILVASHDQELLQSGYFSHVIVLNDGRLVN